MDGNYLKWRAVLKNSRASSDLGNNEKAHQIQSNSSPAEVEMDSRVFYHSSTNSVHQILEKYYTYSLQA